MGVRDVFLESILSLYLHDYMRLLFGAMDPGFMFMDDVANPDRAHIIDDFV